MTNNSHETTPAVLERAHFPPVGLGLASVILGAIGTLFFIVPVIGIPINVAGLLAGMVGIIVALLGGTASLRLVELAQPRWPSQGAELSDSAGSFGQTWTDRVGRSEFLFST